MGECVYVCTQIQRSTQEFLTHVSLTANKFFRANTTEISYSACFSIVEKFGKMLIILSLIFFCLYRIYCWFIPAIYSKFGLAVVPGVVFKGSHQKPAKLHRSQLH